MLSSVESGDVPGNSSSWVTKRRVEFAVADGGSDTSGSKSKEGSDTPTSGYEKMQSRIANRRKERIEKNATGSKPGPSSKNKRVKKSQEKGETRK